MSNQPLTSTASPDSLNSMKEELLTALIEEEEPIYPWNPGDPEAEAYFAEIEQEVSLFEGLTAEEIDAQAENFLAQLHQSWTVTETCSREQSLYQQFEELIPKSCLETILRQAKQIAQENLPQIEQLVQCVKPLFASWSDEDLLIFARPIAYAMRGTPTIKQASWDELPEMDKVRLSLSIAKEALSQIE